MPPGVTSRGNYVPQHMDIRAPLRADVDLVRTDVGLEVELLEVGDRQDQAREVLGGRRPSHSGPISDSRNSTEQDPDKRHDPQK
jgi:hypothetical protein